MSANQTMTIPQLREFVKDRQPNLPVSQMRRPLLLKWANNLLSDRSLPIGPRMLPVKVRSVLNRGTPMYWMNDIQRKLRPDGWKPVSPFTNAEESDGEESDGEESGGEEAPVTPQEYCHAGEHYVDAEDMWPDLGDCMGCTSAKERDELLEEEDDSSEEGTT